MALVVTARVIAEPEGREASLELAMQKLAQEGTPVALAELSQHDRDVLHLMLPGGSARTVARTLGECFGQCDLLVADGEIEVPQLLVSDMDSTMIGQECIDELADYAGIKPQIAAITERAMRGELDFEGALRERVALLKGLEEQAISRCLAERIRPTPGAKMLVDILKARGCGTVLVTGGFHQFADAVAADLGFDRVIANGLGIANGRLTGELVRAISGPATKALVLDQERERLGGNAITLALGDGANDVPMLSAATYGIAYCAKPAAEAAANGFIRRGDLRSVLRLLGVPSG